VRRAGKAADKCKRFLDFARNDKKLDTQWITPHLKQFGAIEISREHYLELLSCAVELPRKFL
jgi:Leu/Phe-tRNA-protein transferase